MKFIQSKNKGPKPDGLDDSITTGRYKFWPLPIRGLIRISHKEAAYFEKEEWWSHYEKTLDTLENFRFKTMLSVRRREMITNLPYSKITAGRTWWHGKLWLGCDALWACTWCAGTLEKKWLWKVGKELNYKKACCRYYINLITLRDWGRRTSSPFGWVYNLIRLKMGDNRLVRISSFDR